MDIVNKYVIIDSAFPVIFTGAMEHKKFKGLGPITGAGFVKFVPRGEAILIETYGESESLGIKAEAEDALIIKAFMKFGDGR